MSTRIGRVGALIAACILLGAVAGCASPWKESFEPSAEGRAQQFAPTESVIVRQVPWERIDTALRELQDEAARSDTHPDDWPAERKAEAHVKLVRALQMSEDPENLVVLGRSVFTTMDAVRPSDGSLAEFAGSIGADYAVWSSMYLGRAEKIVTEPVSTWTTGTEWYYDRSRGRYRPRTATWHSTTYLPVRIEADRNAFMVFYLRKR